MLEYLKRKVCEICFKLFKESITNSHLVGLGTGSTIKYFIDLFFTSNLFIDKEIYVSSIDTQHYIYRKFGVYTKTALESGNRLDLYIDSFDEASTNLDLVKGRGGAFYWEKTLASRSRVRIYIGDYTKWSGKPYLYLKPIPLEVEKEYCFKTLSVLNENGIRARIRMNKSREGPVITDSGNYIIDVYSYSVFEPEEVDKWFKKIEGVVETGIFPNKLVDYILITGPFGNTHWLLTKR